MFKRCFIILKEYFQWLRLSIKYKINYKKVVLVLINENKTLDYYAIAYLKYFVKRKYADEAIILFHNAESKKMFEKFNFSFKVTAVYYPLEKIKKLYDYYSFEKFFDNIVFTYTSFPKYNLLGRVLDETSVNEQDTVCLALYHLREVLAPDETNTEKIYANKKIKAG